MRWSSEGDWIVPGQIALLRMPRLMKSAATALVSPITAALLYERGRTALDSADPVLAGAPTPAGPDAMKELIDVILRGLFTGDFGVALDRAAAFARVEATGSTHLADDYEATEPERASSFTTRALRLSDYAGDLTACAALWRRESLT